MKRFLSLSLAAPVLLSTLIACEGDPGPAGPPGAGAPSVSAVLPGRAYLARKLDLTISGSGTTWDDATTVDLGEGITVDELVVASPTALVARVSIAATAALGARDVTVTGGGVASVYKGAFTVDPPMTLAVKGTAAQGSVFFLSAAGKDLSTPFDTTAESSLFSTTYVGLEVPQSPGLVFQVSNVAAYAAEIAAITDVDVEAGKKEFSIESGVAGTEKVSFPYPEGIEIAARTPVPLVAGAPAAKTVATPFESELYVLTPSAGLNIVDVTMTSGDFEPAFVLIPKSGKFGDRVSGFTNATTLLTTTADPYYAIALDLNGGTGRYNLSSTVTPATATPEAADNETSGTAQAIAALPAVVDSAFSSETDEDWFSVTAAAGDVGKTLNILTVAGDAQADPVVQVYRADGTTVFAESSDADFHERLDTDALPAAEIYYVKVTQSAQGSWATTRSKYRLVVRIK